MVSHLHKGGDESPWSHGNQGANEMQSVQRIHNMPGLVSSVTERLGSPWRRHTGDQHVVGGQDWEHQKHSRNGSPFPVFLRAHEAVFSTGMTLRSIWCHR